jgi:pilus assembly protein Flp/PilA
MIRCLKNLWTGEEGATMVEYALLVALIGAALVVVVTNLSSSIGTTFTFVSTTVASAS